MDVLYLSHCVPNAPDKGEKIRAFHEVAHLASRYRVHLVCFARDRSEVGAARQLADRCASVHFELLTPGRALARAAVQFAAGCSLTASFYSSRSLRRYVYELASRVPFSATVAYSSAMAPYAPSGVPLLLDLVDVDSEKWFDYARMRRPRFLYALEGKRLRRLESSVAGRAGCTFFCTRQEERLFRGFAPDAVTRCLENGVDLEYFDPARCPQRADLHERRFLVFVGAMDYFPNSDAVSWFATRVFPRLRDHDPELEFFIVGRNPSVTVERLSRLEGVKVTGTVPDVRPYLSAAQAVVAPLRIARGIQNKVLEALAMGKPVLASTAVAKTFGSHLPAGLIPCDSDQAFLRAGASLPPASRAIRDDAGRRFSWPSNLAVLTAELERCDAVRGLCRTSESFCSSPTYFRPPGVSPSSVR